MHTHIDNDKDGYRIDEAQFIRSMDLAKINKAIDASIVGWGMSPRGEVAMIVALIGLNAGLIKQDIYVSLF